MDGGFGNHGNRPFDSSTAIAGAPATDCALLDAGHRYQVRRYQIAPGASVPPCHHLHRTEHWTVVQGTARLVCNGKPALFSEGQSFLVPLGHAHKVENPGRIPLVLIKVWTGSYLGDDDRIADSPAL